METAKASNDGNLTASVKAMLSATNNDRGTVRALVWDLEEVYAKSKHQPLSDQSPVANLL
jgi:hypothetical protein